MKKLLLISCLITFQLNAQSDTTIIERDPNKMIPIEKVFTGQTDREPSFPGGQDEMIKWIVNNITYPPTAVKDSIQGNVYVQFIVEKDGSLSNIDIIRSPSDLLSDEVIRLVKAMPNWIPGKFDGELVRVAYTLPVSFKL